jgi:hypothetical protein
MIKASSCSSKLFFIRANARKRKSYIQSLQVDGTAVFSQHQKSQAAHSHFSNLFGPPPPRTHTLNWELLNIQQHDLHHLEEEFLFEELYAAIQDLPSEKAPGPDGFIGVFFKSTWNVIKQDLLAAATYFYHQHDQHLKTVNTAHIVLVPKKADATSLSDYMPISLTHSVAKLIYKVLATRLGSTLNSLISSCQSTFIRKRSIHDNFLYTQNTIRELHRAKHTALFFKLDITKAFDSIRWDFLLEVLQRLGFGSRWRA